MYKRVQLIDFCGTLTISGDRITLAGMNGRLIVSDPPACFTASEPETPKKQPATLDRMDINKAMYHLTYSSIAGGETYWNVYCINPKADPDSDGRKMYQMKWTQDARKASQLMLKLNQEWRRDHDRK